MLIFLMIPALLLVIGCLFHYLTAATRGKQRSANVDGSALLVIDMQEGIINQPHYTHKEKLISTIQQTIEGSQQMDVIFITHSINKHPIDTLLTAG